MCTSVCLCACVCVREGDRESDRRDDRKKPCVHPDVMLIRARAISTLDLLKRKSHVTRNVTYDTFVERKNSCVRPHNSQRRLVRIIRNISIYCKIYLYIAIYIYVSWLTP